VANRNIHDGGAFLRARLASLVAVLPLGVWTVGHLWNNLAAFRGGPAWQSAVTEYAHPFSQLFSAVFALLPLALHTGWGIGRLATSRPNNLRYRFYDNLKYLLQRLSAVGLLLALGAHLWLAMLKPRLVEGHAETFEDLSHQMRSHTPTLVIYLLLTLGVAFHLANGVLTFAMGWGVVASRRALKKAEGGAIAFFFVLLAMGWTAVYALWSAG
jgi:succinate dehydrogenase / fumarate reductase cytochrome b subunit